MKKAFLYLFVCLCISACSVNYDSDLSDLDQTRTISDPSIATMYFMSPSYNLSSYTFNSAGWINPVTTNYNFSLKSIPDGCVYNNCLYLFYEKQNRICYGYMNSLNQWVNYSVDTNITNIWGIPSPVVYNGYIYVFYKSLSNKLMYFMMDSSHIVYGPWNCDISTTSDSPDATVFNSKIYVFFKSDDHNNSVRYKTMTRANNSNYFDYGDVRVNNIQTLGRPVTSVLYNRLYLVHRGMNDHIYYNYMFSDDSWVDPIEIPGVRTRNAPSCFSFNNQLYVFHRDQSASNLFYNTITQNNTISSCKQITGISSPSEPYCYY